MLIYHLQFVCRDAVDPDLCSLVARSIIALMELHQQTVSTLIVSHPEIVSCCLRLLKNSAPQACIRLFLKVLSSLAPDCQATTGASICEAANNALYTYPTDAGIASDALRIASVFPIAWCASSKVNIYL